MALQPTMPNRQPTALDALYREAIALADQARGWFDGPGIAWRAALPVAARTAVAVESLAITARLMAVIAWLLDPAHSGGVAVQPFHAPRNDRALPPASPLIGTPGGDIARQSHDLVARVLALAPPSAAAPTAAAAGPGATPPPAAAAPKSDSLWR
jgi:hypothetical protein